MRYFSVLLVLLLTVAAGFCTQSAAATSCRPLYQPEHLSESAGWLTSPFYPENYDIYHDCWWLITSKIPGEAVAIQFDDFRIVDDRWSSYVRLYDGDSATSSNLITELTGTAAPVGVKYTSRQRSMLVQFYTCCTLDDRGFNATYWSTTAVSAAVCQPSYNPANVTNGWITSPFYPGNYMSSHDCWWLITANSPSQVVALQFTDFKLVAGSASINLYNGEESWWTTRIAYLDMYDPLPLNNTFTSIQRYMWINFYACCWNADRGFNATFWSTEATDTTCKSMSQPENATDLTGWITSPFYPNSYHSNHDCWWVISARFPNQVVALQFTDFQLSRYYSYVRLHNGDGSSWSDQLADLTDGAPLGVNFTSTTRFLWINFYTCCDRVNIGFNATYWSTEAPEYICNSQYQPKNITGLTGWLTSPLYPRNFNIFHDCWWVITASVESQVVALQFTDFRIANGSSFVRLYSGDSYSWSELIAELNESAAVGIYKTKQRSMWINFYTCCSNVDRGFNATYWSTEAAATVCYPSGQPEVVTGLTGWITSPFYPYNFYSSQDCWWLITASFGAGQVVTLQFTEFNFINGFSQLRLYDSDNTWDRPSSLTELSGTTAVGIYTATQRHMLINLHACCQIGDRGFNATYWSAVAPDGVCLPSDQPLYINDETGWIASPFYPRNYYRYHRCWWVIAARSQSEIVALQFTEFQTVNGSSFVRLYNDERNDYGLIAELTGTAPLGVNFTSTQPYMRIYFDGCCSLVDRGFNATFWSIEVPAAVCPAFYQGNITADQIGWISSPYYPGNYHSDHSCWWRITASSPNQVVALQFTYFNLYGAGVQLYDGSYSSSTKIIEFQGQAPIGLPITSRQRTLLVNFYNWCCSYTFIGRGFNATYWSTAAIVSDCSPRYEPQNVTGELGWITSPSYPGVYEIYQNCWWLITANSMNQVVALQFTDFQTNDKEGFVRLYDGSVDSWSELIAEQKGSAPLHVSYRSTQRNMLINFYTCCSTVGRGFNATYWSTEATVVECKSYDQAKNVTGITGWIATPFYPDHFNGRHDCWWLMTANAQSQVITIQFTDFQLIKVSSVVYLFDGNTDSGSKTIAIFEDAVQKSVNYTTTQQYMRIRFSTCCSLVGRGFNATYWSIQAVESICQPYERPANMTEPSGWIASPFYPLNYNGVHDCWWLITASNESQVVVLQFTAFQTVEGTGFVRLYNGDTNSGSAWLADLTGSVSFRTTYATSQQFMRINFYTCCSLVAGGFNASYWSADANTETSSAAEITTMSWEQTDATSSPAPAWNDTNCDNSTHQDVYNSSIGWISSPNHPSYYYDNLDCRWLIFSANQFVTTFFTFFETESCCDFVYIYDGSDINTRLIASLSGYAPLYTQFTTTQSHMLLRFDTDHSVVARGFNATYMTTAAGWLTTEQPGTARPNVTASFTTTTVLTTTSAPGAPVLSPRPYVAVKLNGTMTATGSITQSCSDAFSTDFRNSFQEIVGRVSNLVANRQMCTDGAGPIRIVAGQIQSLFIGVAGQTAFTILVGPTPPDWVSIQTDESCSWQVSDFVRNGNNWRQPIISNIFGCPAITVDSNAFTWQQSFWDVF